MIVVLIFAAACFVLQWLGAWETGIERGDVKE